MVRRLLCLGAILLPLLLSLPACGSSKPTVKIVPDPDGNVVPKAAGGAKGG
jgi:hypothetical protein